MAKKKRKPVQIRCPDCGRPALFRPASDIYGSYCIDREGFVYVCSGYPDKCDAYVGAHAHNLRPKGMMADGGLRHQRILAHQALDAVWKEGWMTRNETYAWLGNKLGLREKEMHIGCFSYYYCQEVVRICGEYRKERAKQEEKRQAVKQKAVKRTA